MKTSSTSDFQGSSEQRACIECGILKELCHENFQKLRYGQRWVCRVCFNRQNTRRKQINSVSRAKHLAACHAYDLNRGIDRKPLPDWVLDALEKEKAGKSP